MQIKNFEKLDIFHLQLFLALYKTPNTVKVAERLNISQSTVSRALAKLRYSFQDQLFVRAQHGLQPTHIAIELAQKLPESLESLLLACSLQNTFEPLKLEGDITIAMHPVILQLLAGDIYKEINQQAPNVRLRLESWGQGTYQKITENIIDIGISYNMEMATKALHRKAIHYDSPCIMARKDHPILKQELTFELLSSYDIFSCVVPEFNDHLDKRQQVERHTNLKFKGSLLCADLSSLIEIIKHSDSLLAGLSLYSTKYCDEIEILAIEIPQFDEIPLMTYGTIKQKNSPKYLWLESIVKQTLNTKLSLVKNI